MNFTVWPKEVETRTVLRAAVVDDGIIDLNVHFDFGQPVRPSETRIGWRFSMRELFSVWTPMGRYDHSVGINWLKRRAESRQAVGTPVLACVNPEGKNLLTVGVSDAKTPLCIACGASEEIADMECYVAFFTSLVAPISSYDATIRIDTRSLEFTETVLDIGSWWESVCGYPRAAVPCTAKLPMNSVWYSFHQRLSAEELLHECKMSAEYGLKTIIIDDGWQTENNERGYAYCGDWELCKSKIPDMAELVKSIHNLGMKVILWYSVPFVGKYSKAYERFKDKALKIENGGDVLVLDVRYPEVRDYLVQVYSRALKDWDLDGFKLDFVDRFRMYSETPDFCEGMDYSSVEDAVECLFAEITEVLGCIKPNLMYEFRQHYVGPSILKYGNMVRVGDCPYDTLRNRTEIVNLRLTSGNTPVHSDMIMWHKDDTVEAVSLQLIATLFGVPQISVKFDNISDEQKKALKFWMSFYRENEKLLHGGKLSVKNPEICYSQISSKNENEAITVNYVAQPFEVDNRDRQIFINATYETESVLKLDRCNASFKAEIRNCIGELVDAYVLDGKSAVAVVKVPASGVMTFEKI